MKVVMEMISAKIFSTKNTGDNIKKDSSEFNVFYWSA